MAIGLIRYTGDGAISGAEGQKQVEPPPILLMTFILSMGVMGVMEIMRAMGRPSYSATTLQTPDPKTGSCNLTIAWQLAIIVFRRRSSSRMAAGAFGATSTGHSGFTCRRFARQVYPQALNPWTDLNRGRGVVPGDREVKRRKNSCDKRSIRLYGDTYAGAVEFHYTGRVVRPLIMGRRCRGQGAGASLWWGW